MNRNEFIKNNSLNKYKKYSIVEMRKKYPNLKFFYYDNQKYIKNYILYNSEMQQKYISVTMAKRKKLKIKDEVIGFICNHYGCFPLYEVIDDEDENKKS